MNGLGVPVSDPAVVITRGEDAEVIDLSPDNVHVLLADGDRTGGALAGHRVRLAPGGNGAVPHRHDLAAEAFYVIGGRAELLADDRVVTVEEGDFVVVPAGMPHAFAAAPGSAADLLIVLTPGIERFGYFRHLEDIHRGRRDRASLRDVQERYDTWFLDSPVWTARR